MLIGHKEILIFSLVFALFSLGLASYAYSETVTFDNGGKRTTTTDPNGNTIITLFGPSGSIIWEKIHDPDGRLIEKTDYGLGESYVEEKTVYVYCDDDTRTEIKTYYSPSGEIKKRWYKEQKYRQPDWVATLDWITSKQWVTEKEWGEKKGKVYPKNQQSDQDVGFGVNAGTTSSIDFDDSIPSWVKTNALWWSENQIDDETFALSIGHLVKENIIKVDLDKINSDGALKVSDSLVIPSWIQNNAKWWAEGMITDGDFKEGIQYMFQVDIISLDTSNIMKTELPDCKKEIPYKDFPDDRIDPNPSLPDYKWPTTPLPELEGSPNVWMSSTPWYELSHELSSDSDVLFTVYEIKKWNEFAMNQLVKIKDYESSFLKDATIQAWDQYGKMDKDTKLSTIETIQEIEKSSKEAESDALYAVQILKDSKEATEEVKEYAKNNDISVLKLEETVKEVQEKIDDMPEINSKTKLKDAYKEAKLAQQKMKDGLKKLEQIEVETPVLGTPTFMINEYEPFGQILAAFFLAYDDGPWDEGGHEPKGSTANDGIWGKSQYVSSDRLTTENDTVVTKEFKCELEDDWIWPIGSGNFYIPPGDCSWTTHYEDDEGKHEFDLGHGIIDNYGEENQDYPDFDRANIILYSVKPKYTDISGGDDSGTSNYAIGCVSGQSLQVELGIYFDDDKERFASEYVRDSIVAGFECSSVISVDGFDCEEVCPQQVLNATNATSILFDVNLNNGKSLVGPYGLTEERLAEIAMYEKIGMQAVYDILLDFNGIRGHKIITDSSGLEKFEGNLSILDEVLPDYEKQIPSNELDCVPEYELGWADCERQRCIPGYLLQSGKCEQIQCDVGYKLVGNVCQLESPLPPPPNDSESNTFAATLKVSSVDESLSGGYMKIGDNVSIEFTIKETLIPNVCSSSFCIYHIDSKAELTVMVNGKESITAICGLGVYDDTPIDGQTFDTFAFYCPELAKPLPNIGLIPHTELFFELKGDSSTISDASVMPTDSQIASFDSSFLEIRFLDPEDFQFDFVKADN